MCTENNMSKQLKILNKFYNNYYSKLMTDEILYYDNLPYILAYEAIDMVTNINNNIQMHFIDHVNKYVNIIFDVKNRAKRITEENDDKEIRKVLHKQLYDEFRKVKNSLICFDKITPDDPHCMWIIIQRMNLFGWDAINFDKNSIHYDLKSNTQRYLKPMFYIANELEKMNDKIIQDNVTNGTKNKQIRLFNVLPSRTNIVPKHICIDTCALIQNFIIDEPKCKLFFTYKKDNRYDEIWNKFFKLEKRSFKKNKYTFHHIIRTDGVSCCILFVRINEKGEPLSKSIQSKKSCNDVDTEHIENAIITNKMKHMKVVCADPNMGDLIYCGAKHSDDTLQTFRYTQNQRRSETKVKKYAKIIHDKKINTKICNQPIQVLEDNISHFNGKSCRFDDFSNYVFIKNEMNDILYQYYRDVLFRKLKFNIFTNTQRSESNMVNHFIDVFGGPKNVMFIMGDYDRGSYNMKGKEPVICKKFRKLFKNAGFMVFLVNEFRTSMLCNGCNEELHKFHERLSHKPRLYKKGEKELVHGLLRCQSVKHTCEVIHNRDKNSVQNMLNIVQHIFETGKRPKEFSRSE